MVTLSSDDVGRLAAHAGVSNEAISGEGDLVGEIKQRFRALSHDELQALTAAALGLWSELEEAAQSDDPHARASAALTCFTIEQVTD